MMQVYERARTVHRMLDTAGAEGVDKGRLVKTLR